MRKKGFETVLVVDDDPLILSFIGDEISFYGYKPVLASNGEQALEMAAAEKIDLLLTDIVMPGISGIDLAQQLAARYPGLKILFMSGYVCPSIAHRGIPGSEYSFIQKPFAPNTLVQKMRHVLKGPEGLTPIS